MFPPMIRDDSDDGGSETAVVDPTLQLNLGLWLLFAGATFFLVMRIWVKVNRSGLWYDDHVLLVSWVSL
jgi:hypothetical protein